jgi:transitional endoplasmic reticulum ATPase
VPEPEEAAREAILRVHTREKPLAEDVDLAALARRLEGYTGAELRAVVRRASMAAIREATDERGIEAATEHAGDIRIRGEHFERALAAVETV